jgi:pimeloyl-ACP methyl ester carboxylesterase
VAHRKSQRPKLVIGFAAETEHLVEHAKAKLARKGCDWILANDVSPETGIMGGDSNTIHLVTASGVEDWPPQSKSEGAGPGGVGHTGGVHDGGVGGSSGDLNQSTSSDLAGDVLAGVKYLKIRKDINPKQIGLIGHSEGGIITPLAATRSKDVAFIVMLAGPGLKGGDILLKQNELIIRASGGSDQDVAKQLDMLNSMFKILEETDLGVAKTKIHELAEKVYNELNDTDKKATGNSSANIEASLLGMTTPWFRFFISYDPVPTLKKVKCPVLALNGSKDLQVPPAEDLAAIAAALKAGKNKDYTTQELPNLNHLFQNCITGAPSEYGTIEETFSPDALKIIGDWIAAHTQKKK